MRDFEGRNLYTAKMRAEKGAAPAGRPRRFGKKQLLLNILIASLILVLIVILLLATLLPGCQQTPALTAPPVSFPVSYSLGGAAAAPSASYDKDANSIPQGRFAGTILPETEDAGDDYVAETLFVGDSNTERMLNYGDVTGVTMQNGIGITSMGITSVLGLRCVRFSGYNDMTIPQAVALMQPRRVVINFGTNNAGMATKNFIESYTAAAAAIHEAYPYADIIVGSIFPIAQNCSYGNLSQKGVDEFNLALVEMAEAENYKFLNWSEALKDANTGYAKAAVTVGDGLHLSKTAMELLFDYFRTHSHATEDSRPKPLNDIPRRLPTPEGLFPKPVVSVPASASVSSSSVAPVNVYAVSSNSGDALGGAQGVAGGTVTFVVTAVPKAGFSAPLMYWQASAGTAAPGPDDPDDPDVLTLTLAIPAGHVGDITVWPVFSAVVSVPVPPVTSLVPLPSSSSSTQPVVSPPPDVVSVPSDTGTTASTPSSPTTVPSETVPAAPPPVTDPPPEGPAE